MPLPVFVFLLGFQATVLRAEATPDAVLGGFIFGDGFDAGLGKRVGLTAL